MPRKNAKSAIGSLFILLILTTTIYSMPLSVLDDPDFIPHDQRVNKTDPSTSSLGIEDASVIYNSGDTAYFVCTEHIFVSPTGGGNDCWGWEAPGGTEYAIFGGRNTVEFYNLTTMMIAASVDAPQCNWRDMKTYDHYCYAVSECVNGAHYGLMIIDMQYLPDSVHYVGDIPTSPGGDYTSHNLSIDTVSGFLYLEGSGGSGDAIRIFNLTNPENPVFVNNFGIANGIHDMVCIDDTCYVAEGYNGTYSIWNLTNKGAPSLIKRLSFPDPGYAHNLWPTDDRNYMISTEETGNKTVKIWDIQDLNNIQLASEYLGLSNLAHNVHVQGDSAYISHYESGVSILDISDPPNAYEVAAYDTYSGSNSPNFNGNWGVFPHTSSGRFYASNMEGQLYILSSDMAILADTMFITDATGPAGSQVRVDVIASFSQSVRTFNIPFSWAGPYNMSFDSASTVGLMTDYFENISLQGIDKWGERASYRITSSNTGTSPDLDPGRGAILSLYFTIPGGAVGASNPVTITPYNEKIPTIINPCITYVPDTVGGEITLGSCCIGNRGNVDGSFELPPDDEGIDIADLVYLVEYAFGDPPGPLPPCMEEADFDGSDQIDITDLVGLVEYGFITPAGPPPAACP